MSILPSPTPLSLHKAEERDRDEHTVTDIFDSDPPDLVDDALSRLQAAGIVLTEWRALLYRRMSVPVVVKDFSYVVPDKDLARASEILSDMGLPLSPHWNLLCKVEGDLHNKGTRHRLTRSSLPGNVQHLVLYPSSFVSFNPEELETTMAMHLAPAPSKLNILLPKPSAVYGWFLRTLRQYPRGRTIRTVLGCDLSELVSYHLLQVQGYAHPEQTPELWEELRIDERIASACEVVKQWTANVEWREGEEEFGEVLQGIIAGTTMIQDLPGRN